MVLAGLFAVAALPFIAVYSTPLVGLPAVELVLVIGLIIGAIRTFADRRRDAARTVHRASRLTLATFAVFGLQVGTTAATVAAGNAAVTGERARVALEQPATVDPSCSTEQARQQLAEGIVPQANEVPEGLTAQQRARCATELQHGLRQELSGLGVAVGTAVALLVGGYACVMRALAGIISGASTYRDRKRLAAILVA